MIAAEAEGGSMPSVSALVMPDNGPSHRIFDFYEFGRKAAMFAGEQDLRWLEAGSSTPAGLGPEVYVPPELPLPAPKLGRNDPCWCGSGTKFKKCMGAERRAARGPGELPATNAHSA